MEDWYEIVSGERRYRASQLAGAADIPAMIRPLSDAQVLEIQLVENLQRDDLSPLEEAEGYERLVASTGIAKEDIGARIGRSRGYVYARLKLLDLCQEGRQALEAGQIDASRALLIARVPDGKLQARALKEALSVDWNKQPRHSFRSLQAWVQDELMLALGKASFKITDATLVPAAGSCKECPKRTGANPDLFSDVKGADVCTDVTCYRAKEDAHTEREVAAARERGQVLITGKEAQAAMPTQYSSKINGYQDLDKPDDRLDSRKSLRKVLGKDMPTPMLLKSPHDGKLIEVLPKDQVTKLLQAKGQLSDRQARAKRPIDKDEEKRLALAELETRWRRRAIEQLDAHMRTTVTPAGDTTALARVMARMMLTGLRQDEGLHLANVLGLGKVSYEDSVKEQLQTADGPTLVRIMLVLLMEHDTQHVMGYDYESHEHHKVRPAMRIAAVAEAMGVDIEPIRPAVQAEIADAEAAKKARAAAREAKLAKRETTPAKGETKPAAGDTQTREPTSRDDIPWGGAVRFKTDLRGPGGKIRKVSGRDGTVIGRMGDRALMVRFGPSTHEVASADWAELLVLEAPTAAAAPAAKPARKGKTSKAEAQAGIAAELQALEGKRAPATPLEALAQGAEAAA